jgi:hypothetical protein
MSTSRWRTSGTGPCKGQGSVSVWFRCPSYRTRTGESYSKGANVDSRNAVEDGGERAQDWEHSASSGFSPGVILSFLAVR